MEIETKSRNITDLSLTELVEQYKQAATLSGVYTETGEYKKGNLQYNNLNRAYKEIKKRGHEGHTLLLTLLDTEVLSVKVWVGYHALDFAPETGERVLSEIAKNATGIQRLNAEITLREWKAGKLKF